MNDADAIRSLYESLKDGDTERAGVALEILRGVTKPFAPGNIALARKLMRYQQFGDHSHRDEVIEIAGRLFPDLIIELDNGFQIDGRVGYARSRPKSTRSKNAPRKIVQEPCFGCSREAYYYEDAPSIRFTSIDMNERHRCTKLARWSIGNPQ